MAKQTKVCTYGGSGVDIALESFSYPGPDVVFWSPQRCASSSAATRSPTSGCSRCSAKRA